jgi:hypothetical protein
MDTAELLGVGLSVEHLLPALQEIVSVCRENILINIV